MIIGGVSLIHIVETIVEQYLLPFGVVLGSELRPPFIGVANPLLDATDAALFITLIMTAAAANSASRQELLIGYFNLSLVVNNL